MNKAQKLFKTKDYQAVATKCDCTASYVHMIVSGERPADSPKAKKVLKAVEEKVKTMIAELVD